MVSRVAIYECVREGFKYPKIVAYDERNQAWVFTGTKLLRGDPRSSALLAKVREAGSIDPTYWRKRS